MLVLELPHWLMIAGSALVAAGFMGLGLISRSKRIERDPVVLPGDLTSWRTEGSDVKAASAVRDFGT